MGFAIVHSSGSDDSSSKREWVVVPSEADAQATFSCEGTVVNGESSRAQLEFRALLDYPVAKLDLLDFIKNIRPGYELCLHGWFQIRIYNDVPAHVNRLPLAVTLYQNFIRDNDHVDALRKKRIEQVLDAEQNENGELVRLFDLVYVRLFLVLFKEVYSHFIHCPEYEILKAKIRDSYNTVLPKDFRIKGIIGTGGFGLVCEVEKKSSGIRYAMKVQAKSEVFSMFGDDPWRACLEMRAFASCKHPFIVELVCAFQTDSLLVLVMSLGSWCDLSKLLRAGGPLSYDHVCFYAAEITSALSYLHAKHFVYRDLKPGNVLLNADGHIQLVDFGAVCDLSGTVIGKSMMVACRVCHQLNVLVIYVDSAFICTESCNKIPLALFAEEDDGVSSLSSGFDEDGSFQPVQRAKSLVGTYGYMAPEMVVLLGEENRRNSGYDSDKLDRGYTTAVDWWSLGVLVYKMLVGTYPFRCGKTKHEAPTWEMLSEPVDYNVPALSKSRTTAIAFISGLLTVDDTHRLGAAPGGSAAVRKHPFFNGLNWEALQAKRIMPPPLPRVNVRGVGNRGGKDFGGLTELVIHAGKVEWLDFGQSKEDVALQHHFASWNYTSPKLVTSELEISASKNSVSRTRTRSRRETNSM